MVGEVSKVIGVVGARRWEDKFERYGRRNNTGYDGDDLEESAALGGDDKGGGWSVGGGDESDARHVFGRVLDRTLEDAGQRVDSGVNSERAVMAEDDECCPVGGEVKVDNSLRMHVSDYPVLEGA